ncbi:YdhK family protein [Macrococcus equipercicus]|uniref:DUF1541 domain-containing protein n=1 Tax=Macrococcus equipercicus TaxID=69967 RepID=A0A9Q9BX02_9STAP|nr:YdhK family protein [Macrococcus equipercicus]KAA1037583.1 DUF1541 domain-containing protein [Macrococcus equipercicus]UTH14092.1 YdhK family protein [Macrococcus equipercicus]
MKKRLLLTGSMIAVLTLTGCKAEPQQTEHHHSSMDKVVPKGMKKAAHPKYEVGDKVTVLADHMEGMKGAAATISGAFDTTVYSVSYNPTNGGDKVDNHQWVVHEELKDVGGQALAKGDKAVITASHMKGMKGAEATIDSAKKTTVYMIDYVDQKTGEKMVNHKWLVEDELKQ